MRGTSNNHTGVNCLTTVLFHHKNIGHFSCNLWKKESKNCHLPILPKAALSTIGNWEQQQIQPIRNMEKMKNRF
jgi:hypothetical protein